MDIKDYVREVVSIGYEQLDSNMEGLTDAGDAVRIFTDRHPEIGLSDREALALVSMCEKAFEVEFKYQRESAQKWHAVQYPNKGQYGFYCQMCMCWHKPCSTYQSMWVVELHGTRMSCSSTCSLTWAMGKADKMNELLVVEEDEDV